MLQLIPSPIILQPENNPRVHDARRNQGGARHSVRAVIARVVLPDQSSHRALPEVREIRSAKLIGACRERPSEQR